MSGSRSPVNPSLYKRWGDFNERRARLCKAPIAYDRWYDYTYGEKSGEAIRASERQRDEEWLRREETDFAEKERQRDAYIWHVTECINKGEMPVKYDAFIVDYVENEKLVESREEEAIPA
jgi:hypothetical protein